MMYPDYADKIITALEASGESAYIVGGSVRDMLLGTVPNDYDIATSALPQKTKELFADMRVIDTGIKHGTVTVICDSVPVEVTTYRIDGTYTDFRRPDAVRFTDDIEADLSRRDFTVNAMAYNKRAGLVDIFDGQGDIKRRVLRAVGDARVRFGEDALRIMRAFRFSAQLGFAIEANTLSAAEQLSSGLGTIARERIGAEFLKLVCSPSPAMPLMLMKQKGILSYVLGDHEPSNECISLLHEMPNDDYARLGFLLSGAEETAAWQILNSLRLSAKQIKGAMAVRAGSAQVIKTSADARRLFALVGIYAPAAAKASELLGCSENGAYDITLKEQNTPHSLRELNINGKDIAELGVKGKQIGKILEEILALVVDNPALNEHTKLIELAAHLIDKGDREDGTA